MNINKVIKYEGDNNTFIWKHPCEDFNTTSQLIVHESQEAIFFLNGQALDLFGPGRHTLQTQNIPLIRRILNLPTGGETPFHCEVYFINKTEQMAIKWGTNTKIQYLDPTYKFPLSIGACGEMSLCVNDGRKLLIKLVGTECVLEQEQLTRFFRSFLITRVKSYLAQEMKNSSINIFEIDEKLEYLSSEIQKKLIGDFFEYGVNLNKFFITTIAKPDNDPQYEKFKELHFRQYADIAEAKIRQQVGVIEQETKTKQTIIESKGLAEKRNIEGYSYQQERSFDVAEGFAANEGAGGNLASLGIGLGVMSGIGNTIGNVVNSTVNNTLNNSNKFCSKCGAKLQANGKFCPECGANQTQKSICSKCGYQFTEPSKFCPNCGTKRETF